MLHRLILKRYISILTVRVASTTFAESSVPPVTTSSSCGSARCSVLQRSHSAVGETNAHVLGDHVGRQKLLESDHAVPRRAVERIAHGPGVRITGVKNATVARCVVAHLRVSLRVRHLLPKTIC